MNDQPMEKTETPNPLARRPDREGRRTTIRRLKRRILSLEVANYRLGTRIVSQAIELRAAHARERFAMLKLAQLREVMAELLALVGWILPRRDDR